MSQVKAEKVIVVRSDGTQEEIKNALLYGFEEIEQEGRKGFEMHVVQRGVSAFMRMLANQHLEECVAKDMEDILPEGVKMSLDWLLKSMAGDK